MRRRVAFELPDDKRELEDRARRLEWWTIFFLLTITAVIWYTMGSSQAMKTAWIEDVLSLVPPISFLVATRVKRREPDDDYPYGWQRAMTLAFLTGAFALLLLGSYMIYDAATKLLTRHHPTLGHREILGLRTWSGWWMIAALTYSAIPPVVLGHMKKKVAEELHSKALHTDGDMNRADWTTAVAATLGILGIRAGLWWADAVAALLISLGVVKDGFDNMRAAFGDILDRAPTTVDHDRVEREPLDTAREALRDLPWVADADVRLREEGPVLTGEAFVVPSDGRGVSLEQLAEASRVLHQGHWRIHEVVVTAVEDVDRPRNPQAGIR